MAVMIGLALIFAFLVMCGREMRDVLQAPIDTRKTQSYKSQSTDSGLLKE